MTMTTKTLLAAGLALVLPGCISLTPDPPESLLTLTPASTAPTGAMPAGAAANALAVAEPSTSARLAVTRVPVQVTSSSLAYLKDAQWVERPTRLFRNLLIETLRARGGRMVIADGELATAPATTLSGRLVEMGYDAASQSVIVRYDAVLQAGAGELRSQRFEAVVPGVAAETAPVGAALNEAANRVAADVAEWVG